MHGRNHPAACQSAGIHSGLHYDHLILRGLLRCLLFTSDLDSVARGENNQAGTEQEYIACLVFVQAFVLSRDGMICGPFAALSFGMTGIGAATLYKPADAYHGIGFIYGTCAFLLPPGMPAVLLPYVRKPIAS
jgi:hypothetical protein